MQTHEQEDNSMRQDREESDTSGRTPVSGAQRVKSRAGISQWRGNYRDKVQPQATGVGPTGADIIVSPGPKHLGSGSVTCLCNRAPSAGSTKPLQQKKIENKNKQCRQKKMRYEKPHTIEEKNGQKNNARQRNSLSFTPLRLLLLSPAQRSHTTPALAPHWPQLPPSPPWRRGSWSTSRALYLQWQ